MISQSECVQADGYYSSVNVHGHIILVLIWIMEHRGVFTYEPHSGFRNTTSSPSPSSIQGSLLENESRFLIADDSFSNNEFTNIYIKPGLYMGLKSEPKY